MTNKERVSREGTQVARYIVSPEVAERAVRLASKYERTVKIIAQSGDEYVHSYGLGDRINIVPQGKVRIQIEPADGPYLRYTIPKFWEVVMRRGRDAKELEHDTREWFAGNERERENTHRYAEQVRGARASLAKERKGLSFLALPARREERSELERRLKSGLSMFRYSIQSRKRRVEIEKREHYRGAFLPKVDE